MNRTVKNWLIFLVLLIDEALALALVLLILWAFKIAISLPVAITLALLIGTSAFVFHKVVIPSFHKEQVTGWEGMVGQDARVVETLAPVGVVRVEGELWKAKSVEDDIEAGEDVEVLEVKKLSLEVKRKSQ